MPTLARDQTRQLTDLLFGFAGAIVADFCAFMPTIAVQVFVAGHPATDFGDVA